jgi:hypothetical protein
MCTVNAGIRVYCPFKVPFIWRIGRGSSLVFQGGLMGALREIQLVGCPSPKVRDVMTLRPRVYRPRTYFSCSIRPRVVSSKVPMIPENQQKHPIYTVFNKYFPMLLFCDSTFYYNAEKTGLPLSKFSKIFPLFLFCDSTVYYNAGSGEKLGYPHVICALVAFYRVYLFYSREVILSPLCSQSVLSMRHSWGSKFKLL